MVAGTYGRGVWRKNLGAGDCVDFTDLTIDSYLDWNGSPVCFNITVASGGTLNIAGSVLMAYRIFNDGVDHYHPPAKNATTTLRL